ncbi:MAG: hypothetical protein FWE95_05300 [Planctomycetaceae bacterium]|nr:hypothetical protein [Planctomycetaceae bacterium]
MSEPTFMTQLASERFEALVSKGIHAILFPVKKTGVDSTKNLLYGYPIGTFNTSGETVEMEDFQDQIRGGMCKTSIAGQTDPGDITFDAYFTPDMGKPKIEGVVNSMVTTPQFILTLARKKSSTKLEGFFSAGVNYSGGNEIKGDLGKAMKTSLKFKITGESLVGYDEVGEIDMSLYEAGKES